MDYEGLYNLIDLIVEDQLLRDRVKLYFILRPGIVKRLNEFSAASIIRYRFVLTVEEEYHERNKTVER